MIKCFFVETSSIISTRLKSDFDESQIEELSDLIIEADGLIKPLILESIGDEKYNVVEGHLEYYAAVRAKEKDLSKAEEVNAFIVSNNSRQSVIDQVKLLLGARAGNIDNIENPAIIQPKKVDHLTSDTTLQQLKLITDRLDKHSHILDTLKNQPKQESLDSTAHQIQIVLRQIAKQEQTLNSILKLLEPSPKLSEVEILELINTLSCQQLEERMKKSTIANATKIAANIIAKRNTQPAQKFISWKEITSAKIGVGAMKAKEIIAKFK
ncbi:ParB/Srx family N-terminal domain-containing protein [Chamaesiphon sp. VAR_48_metabat_403]|uniref:ParB/Srx family N-terminal domain-containing protein n=1 Tax=Chamaesiphon sp. VAR_48_metabat_403 TaxID=2964700 RepID=UPI00286D825C|nr:ParB/Srx family N-terminal domain-containing protein [Chamaesiphon sp. VAR_48_metabat_403]